MSADHGQFTIVRELEAPVALVFQAWADKDAKARWFTAPVDWTQVVRQHDFRIGGRERLRGKWPNGRITDFCCEYRDIIQDARIVYVYDMWTNDRKISVSLATITFGRARKGTKLTVTEQGVFLDGYVDAGSRERGTNQLLDAMERSLKE